MFPLPSSVPASSLATTESQFVSASEENSEQLRKNGFNNRRVRDWTLVASISEGVLVRSTCVPPGILRVLNRLSSLNQHKGENLER